MCGRVKRAPEPRAPSGISGSWPSAIAQPLPAGATRTHTALVGRLMTHWNVWYVCPLASPWNCPLWQRCEHSLRTLRAVCELLGLGARPRPLGACSQPCSAE